MTDRELIEQAYAEGLEELLDVRIFDNPIQKAIEDIKEIVAVLDPKGYEWAQKTKAERERYEKETDHVCDPLAVGAS